MSGEENGTAPVSAAASDPAAATATGNLLADAKPADAAAADPAAKPAAADPAAAPAADKPAEGEAPKEGDDKKPAEVPAEYADFTLPEGVQLNAEKLTEFKEIAKANNLTQEAAQTLVDKHVDALKEANEAPYKLWEETQKTWQETVKADPEIGGAKFEENLAAASKALDAFGGKELRDALAFTGAGNNPEVVRAFVRIGKAMTEGGFIGGNAPAGTKSVAQTLYPTMNKTT